MGSRLCLLCGVEVFEDGSWCINESVHALLSTFAVNIRMFLGSAPEPMALLSLIFVKWVGQLGGRMYQPCQLARDLEDSTSL